MPDDASHPPRVCACCGAAYDGLDPTCGCQYYLACQACHRCAEHCQCETFIEADD